MSSSSIGKPLYWAGRVSDLDDFGNPIFDVFIDGKTKQGPWAIMSQSAWNHLGCGRLGTGFGQKYKKQDDGRWLKVEG